MWMFLLTFYQLQFYININNIPEFKYAYGEVCSYMYFFGIFRKYLGNSWIQEIKTE